MHFGKQGTLLSVVVPVSNLAGQLHNLKLWLSDVDSLELLQVILVHDIKDEITSGELKSFCLGNKRVSLIESHFGSPGLARNIGIENATSNWICFWDADDLPHVLTVVQSLLLHQHDYEVIIGDYEVRDFISDTLIAPHGEISKDRSEVSLARSPGLWRYLFQTSLIKKIRFPPLLMGEDQVFLSSIDPLRRKTFIESSLFYTYFTNRPGQLTGFKPALTDLLDAQRLIAQNCRQGDDGAVGSFQYILLARLFLTGFYKRNFKLTLRTFVQFPGLIRTIGGHGTFQFSRTVYREIKYYFVSDKK
jgi:glycosyltransferase involved in cell wall biosynthesis